MEYKILEGDKAALEAQVNAHLKEGWNLHGSGYCANSTHYQPISKGGEIIMQAETLEPADRTQTIVFDCTELNKTLSDFLTKAAKLTGEPAKKEKDK